MERAGVEGLLASLGGDREMVRACLGGGEGEMKCCRRTGTGENLAEKGRVSRLSNIPETAERGFYSNTIYISSVKVKQYIK